MTFSNQVWAFRESVLNLFQRAGHIRNYNIYKAGHIPTPVNFDKLFTVNILKNF